MLSKVHFKQTQVNTVPTFFLLRHHQHDTHEALGHQVCKDRLQVDLVKTVFFSEGNLSLNLEERFTGKSCTWQKRAQSSQNL